MAYKKQTHCKNGHELTPENVYVATHKSDGRQYRQCRICQRLDGKRRYDSMTPEERAARRQQFPSRAKGKHYQRKYKYGMTESAYRELLIAQDGLCIICEREGAIEVDHDHETGEVRGILCGHCNRALGLFDDNADALAFAAQYVKGVA